MALKALLVRLRPFREDDGEDLLREVASRDLAEHYLQHAITAALDLHARLGERAPELDTALWRGLRDRLVVEYVEPPHEQAIAALGRPLDALERFAAKAGSTPLPPTAPAQALPPAGTLEDVLEASDLFGAMDAEGRRALVSCVTPRRYRGGTRLFRQGEPGEFMAIIVEGTFAAYAARDDGGRVELNRMGSGTTVGEMTMLDPAPRSAEVEALEHGLVYQLDRQGFLRLRRRCPRVAVALVDAIAAVITERLRKATRRIAEAQGRPTPPPTAFAGAPRTLPPPSGPGEPWIEELDLGDVRSLAGLSLEELQRLAMKAAPTRYREGAWLCREGERGETCWLILQGRLEVLAEGGGAPQRLAVLGPGAFVGQLALLDDAPRSASLRSEAGDLLTLAIDRRAFLELLRAGDVLALKLHEQVTIAGIRQLRRATKHVARLCGDSEAPTRPEPAIAPTVMGAAPTEEAIGLQPTVRAPETGAAAAAVAPPGPEEEPARPEPVWKQILERNKAQLEAREPLSAPYVQRALGEWGLALADLDQVTVKKTEGSERIPTREGFEDQTPGV